VSAAFQGAIWRSKSAPFTESGNDFTCVIHPYEFRLARSRSGFGKDHSLNYVVAFAALGMFVSLMALALGDASIAAAW
jgi:hypothetical protein